MERKKYRQIRVVIAIFIGALVSFSVNSDNYLLAGVSVVTGMVFMILVRSKYKIRIDEREILVREKAAQITYAIFAPTIGIGAFLLMIPYQDLSPVFAKGEFSYLESLGMILAYLTLFIIAIYAISFHFLNRKFGGGGDDE